MVHLRQGISEIQPLRSLSVSTAPIAGLDGKALVRTRPCRTKIFLVFISALFFLSSLNRGPSLPPSLTLCGHNTACGLICVLVLALRGRGDTEEFVHGHENMGSHMRPSLCLYAGLWHIDRKIDDNLRLCARSLEKLLDRFQWCASRNIPTRIWKYIILVSVCMSFFLYK